MSTEPDILEALDELAASKVGGPMPKCLAQHATYKRVGEWVTDPETGTSVGLGANDWGTGLSEIARRSAAEIRSARKLYDLEGWITVEKRIADLEATVSRLEVENLMLRNDILPDSIDPAGVRSEDGL